MRMRQTMNCVRLVLLLMFCWLTAAGSCWAIAEERFVESEFQRGDFVLARAGGAAAVYLDASDYAIFPKTFRE